MGGVGGGGATAEVGEVMVEKFHHWDFPPYHQEDSPSYYHLSCPNVLYPSLNSTHLKVIGLGTPIQQQFHTINMASS